jgi:ABC-type polysaccharide/polyol phosphate transport system ATPase subunit
LETVEASVVLDCAQLVFPASSDKSMKRRLMRISQTKTIRNAEPRTALDVSLAVGAGERVGVVGLNGAGKTTLLRVIAGILPTTSGVAEVHGRIGTILGDGVGFELEQSAWDNILTRLVVMGMTPAEAKRMRPEVAEFVELGERLYEPMKHYSAGMVLRVAFAVATSAQPEILLIDEVIGAGDILFAERAQERLVNLFDRASILVLTSHNLTILTEYCSRGVWLEQGHIVMDAPMEEVVAAYRLRFEGQ